MGGSNVKGWFAAFERASRERERGRAELAWLGLVVCDDEVTRGGDDCFDRSAAVEGWRRRASAGEVGSSWSKAVDPATRLGFLLGIVMMIASLTTVLFCG
jgi:hypothetical protein